MHTDVGRDMIQWVEELITLTRASGTQMNLCSCSWEIFKPASMTEKPPHECFEELF